MRELRQSERFAGPVIAGTVTGAIAEPLGIILPGAKAKTLWNTALKSAAVTGAFGATGYVDKEAGQTRLANTGIAASIGFVGGPTVHALGIAAHHLAGRTFKNASNAMLDNFERQTLKYQRAGANQQLALRLSKKKLGLTDEDLAMASLSTSRKQNILTKSNARKKIDEIERMESAMSKAPTSKFGKGVEVVMTPISTRLQRMSPRVFHRLKDHDRLLQKRETELFHRVNPFLQAMGKFSKADQALMGKALFSGDFKTVEDMLHAAGGKKLMSEFGQVRKVLADIYKDLKKTGYKIPEVQNYFPRIAKDLEAISNLQHDQVSRALRAARQKKGGELTETEVARAMDDLIVRTSNRTFAQTTGSLKGRKKQNVTELMYPHYEEPGKALRTYIRSTTADMERRRLFNDFGYDKKPDIDGGDLEDSIGALLSSERLRGLSKADQDDITSILRSRFGPGEQVSSEWVQVAKNLMYTLTLGNPLAASTQLGDVVFAAHKNGIINAVTSMFGKKLIKKEVLGLEDAIEEFVSTSGTKKVLDWSLKWGGFKTVDRLGKETLLNSSLKKFNKWSKTEKGREKFRKEWSRYFEGDTEKLLEDVANKKLTENVKLLLWHELSGVQPISLSEMPQKYLNHPDGRLLYMLRTFTIKQFDFMRREIFNLARHGKTYEAALNTAKFASLFIAANSGVDALKDFMKGKEIEMEDHIVDNAWTLVGLNKYTIDGAKRKGPSRAVIDFVAPPISVFDDLYRGIDDPKRLWNLLPPFGKLIHGWQEDETAKYYNAIDFGKDETSDYNLDL